MTQSRLAVLGMLAACAATCSGRSPSSPTSSAGGDIAAVSVPTPVAQQPRGWNVDRDGVPKFITHTYIDLSYIREISRFRSGEGHSYTDAVETCRSMKHYFKVSFGM